VFTLSDHLMILGLFSEPMVFKKYILLDTQPESALLQKQKRRKIGRIFFALLSLYFLLCTIVTLEEDCRFKVNGITTNATILITGMRSGVRNIKEYFVRYEYNDDKGNKFSVDKMVGYQDSKLLKTGDKIQIEYLSNETSNSRIKEHPIISGFITKSPILWLAMTLLSLIACWRFEKIKSS